MHNTMGRIALLGKKLHQSKSMRRSQILLCLVNAQLLQAYAEKNALQSIIDLEFAAIYLVAFFFFFRAKLIGASVGCWSPTPVNRQGQWEKQIVRWTLTETQDCLMNLDRCCWARIWALKLYEPWVINSNQYLSHTSPGRELPTGANVHNHRTISLYQCRVQKHHSDLPFQSAFIYYWASVGWVPHPHLCMHRNWHKYVFSQIKWITSTGLIRRLYGRLLMQFLYHDWTILLCCFYKTPECHRWMHLLWFSSPLQVDFFKSHHNRILERFFFPSIAFL